MWRTRMFAAFMRGFEVSLRDESYDDANQVPGAQPRPPHTFDDIDAAGRYVLYAPRSSLQPPRSHHQCQLPRIAQPLPLRLRHNRLRPPPSLPVRARTSVSRVRITIAGRSCVSSHVAPLCYRSPPIVEDKPATRIAQTEYETFAARLARGDYRPLVRKPLSPSSRRCIRTAAAIVWCCCMPSRTPVSPRSYTPRTSPIGRPRPHVVPRHSTHHRYRARTVSKLKVVEEPAESSVPAVASHSATSDSSP